MSLWFVGCIVGDLVGYIVLVLLLLTLLLLVIIFLDSFSFLDESMCFFISCFAATSIDAAADAPDR